MLLLLVSVRFCGSNRVVDLHHDEYCCVTCRSDILAVLWQKDSVKRMSDIDSSSVCAIQAQFFFKKSNALVRASRSKRSS